MRVAWVMIDHTNSSYVMVMVNFCCSQFVPKRAFRISSLAAALSIVVWIWWLKKRKGSDLTPSSLGRRSRGCGVLHANASRSVEQIFSTFNKVLDLDLNSG